MVFETEEGRDGTLAKDANRGGWLKVLIKQLEEMIRTNDAQREDKVVQRDADQ